jgi:hypothetical protein
LAVSNQNNATGCEVPKNHEEMKNKAIAGLAWIALAASLAVLSKDGASRCGLNEQLSWGFAMGLTLAASALTHVFRETLKPMYALLALMAVLLLAAMDSMSFRGIVAESNQAPVVVAESVRQTRQANVDALREQEAIHQALFADAMSKAEKEKLGVNGKAGEGPAWMAALSFARGQQNALHGIQGQLEKALIDLEASAGEASMLVVKRHPMSDVDPWAVFGGFVALEIILAGIAWAWGEEVQASKKIAARIAGDQTEQPKQAPPQDLSPVQPLRRLPPCVEDDIMEIDQIPDELGRKASAIYSRWRRQQKREQQ